MAIYPNTVSDRMEPLDEPEPTSGESMDECRHYAACRRVLETYDGAVDEGRVGWWDALAARLGCGGCDCWEED